MTNINYIKKLLLEMLYSLYLIGLIIIYPILIILAIFIKFSKFKQNKQRNKSFSGQVAVITGSARGLGRILAVELAKRGCHIAVVDVQQDLAEETALYIKQIHQVEAKAYKVDVSDYQQLVQLNKNVSQDLGDVTILINNAAILTFSSMDNPTPEEIHRMINVNFTAICFSQKVFLPKMKALNRGHIVNICSCAALFTSPLLDIYAGTKAAVRSITSALRIELLNESKNITATTVMPMFLNTNKRIEELVKETGLGKILQFSEGHTVAEYVLEGMLNDKDEITVPYTVLYSYKLIELLPICIKEIGALLISFGGFNRLCDLLKAKRE